MIDKEKLLRLLQECDKLEAEAVSICEEKLENPVFFQVFSVEDRDRVKKALKTLVDDSKSHQGILELLLTRTEGSSKDDF